jgi:hypothetical protein
MLSILSPIFFTKSLGWFLCLITFITSVWFIVLIIWSVFIFMIRLVRWWFCLIRFIELLFSFFKCCLWGLWLLVGVIFIYVQIHDIFICIFRLQGLEFRPSFLKRFIDVGCFSLCSCCMLRWFLLDHVIGLFTYH